MIPLLKNFFFPTLIFWITFSVSVGFPESAMSIGKIWIDGNGLWHTASNWNPVGEPESTDSVILTSGNINLTTDVTIGALYQTNGSIGGTGNLTITGSLTQDCYGCSLSTGSGNIMVEGPFDWIIGSIGDGIASGIVTANGLITIPPPYVGHWVRKKTLICNGGILWQGGNIGATDGGVWRIPENVILTETGTSGTMLIYDNFGGGGGTIENQGTILRSGSSLILGGGGVTQENFIYSRSFINLGGLVYFISSVFTNTNSGTLAGNGMFKLTGTFINNGIIAPGNNNIGTLSIECPNLEIKTLNIEIASGIPDSTDILQVTGSVDLSGGSILNVTETTTNCNSKHTFLRWTGTRIGSFSTLNLPIGYSVIYDDVHKKADLGYILPDLIDTVNYADADGDGFSNAAIMFHSCNVPPGYVGNSLDCNAAAASINPTATEACNNMDDDCDALIDEGILSTPPTPSISAGGPTTFYPGGSVVLTVSSTGNTWTAKTNFGGVGRMAASGFSMLDKAYLGTGYNGTNKKDFWEYTPSYSY